MEKRVQFDQVDQAYHTEYQDQVMLSPGSVSDLRSSQGTAQSFQYSTKPSRKTLKGKNSVTKNTLFQDFNPKSKFSISDQPYFSKSWSKASPNYKLGKHNGSKSTFRCDTSSELVDTLNESIIKSQKTNLNPQNGDCRRLMMNMVTNLRHQKHHKENQP